MSYQQEESSDNYLFSNIISIIDFVRCVEENVSKNLLRLCTLTKIEFLNNLYNKNNLNSFKYKNMGKNYCINAKAINEVFKTININVEKNETPFSFLFHDEYHENKGFVYLRYSHMRYLNFFALYDYFQSKKIQLNKIEKKTLTDITKQFYAIFSDKYKNMIFIAPTCENLLNYIDMYGNESLLFGKAQVHISM
ncbi:hypothetical protein COBT_003587 [Conglomerata obtusa]